METLKWLFSFMLSVIGVSVLVGATVVLTLFSSVLWVVMLIFGGIVLVAMAIKEFLDGEHKS